MTTSYPCPTSRMNWNRPRPNGAKAEAPVRVVCASMAKELVRRVCIRRRGTALTKRSDEWGTGGISQPHSHRRGWAVAINSLVMIIERGLAAIIAIAC